MDGTRIEARFDRWLGAIMGFAERLLARLFHAMPERLATGLQLGLLEFLAFGIKQAWACLFGGLMLAGIIGTSLWYPEGVSLARYDFLFLYAVAIQVIFLLTKIEHLPEASVILIFHIVGTVMEVFKTDMGSWAYPEENIFRIGGVPMFSGFMYAAVGSYLARVMRIFEFRYSHYPRRLFTLILAGLVYINFFSHHYIMDFRYGLFAGVLILYGRTFVQFRVWRWRHRMPLAVGFFLVALFLWLAENIGTLTNTWMYPDQADGWQMVSFSKMGSWYLLMILSYALVTIVHPPRKATPGAAFGLEVVGLEEEA